MKRFNMCSACKDEYLDISNIRYHAETIACDVCGPELCLYKGKEKVICNTSPVEATIKLIKAGYIIAVKGIGGFHIVCDATNTETVKKLRLRKRRQMSKPFAIMSNSVEKVKTYCNVNSQEEQLLTQPQRPIVLLQKKKGCKLITDEVAPDNKYLGVMLPYTPIHYLILDDDELLAIVATSGNVSGEPLIKDNDEAFDLLTDIADYLLIHNRDIYHRCDDSIVKNVNNHQVMIRRARGYVPMPVWINYPDRRLRCSLGVGAELKNTFCILKDNMGFISQHIGDMHNIDTLNFFKEEIEHFKQVLSADIEIIAHDMHPEYLTTRYALEFAKLYDIPHVSIQHHHAHVVSCMIEHGIVNEQVIGIVADGVGFGTDGNIWGFEFIIADLCSFKRYAHLRYVPMPGGDKATQEPWRMAVSYLYTVYDNNIPEMFVHRWGEYKVAGIIDMINKRINTPATSSCGRLFDAIASILNIKDTIEYDAQAAIELEMIADEYEHTGYRFDILENISETVIIDPTCVIADIVQDVYQDVKVPVISAKFHNAIIAVIVDVSKCMRRTYGINKVVLSGGVFQNSYILERIRGILEAEGFVPVLHSEIPPNDAGISLGQVIIANMNMRGMS
jgi:hydrogenase maturation protein HypF